MMVSIIVPVFNVEKYIEKCILSVIEQTYSNWELLLINDGSSDNSGVICDNFSLNDDRIKVIHKSNTGVSDTRNLGLDMAKGKYVIFLDADDYWYEKMALSQLVKTAETNDLDLVRGEYKAVDQDGNLLFERFLTKSKKTYSGQILSSGIFHTKIICGENFLVLSLIRRDVIGNLRFNKNKTFLEDMEFYTYLLLKKLRCMFIPLRFYAYRKILSSASNTPKIQNLSDSFSMCDVFNNCAEETIDEILKESYRYYSVMMYYWTLDTMSQEPYYANRLSLIDELSLIDLNKRVRRWIKSTNKIYSLLIYLSPNLSIIYFRIKHKIGNWIRRIQRSIL